MNCANHPDIASAAFCRTCGKALCANCTRNVRGVIYCENCLAARLEGTTPPPPTAYQQVMDQGAGLRVPPPPGAGPHPAVAGILAAFFPFGVGAVYCGQYAKGLAHLVIFTALVWGESTSNSDSLSTVLGFGIAFFCVYQIIDAVRTAKALQMGQPAPDPLGLASTFGAGDKLDTSKVPTGALILIFLGVLFLLHTLDIWSFSLNRFWPLTLIGLGGWLFARRFGLIGPPSASCQCDQCRARCLMGPAVLVTLGIQFLLDSLGVISFGRTLPALLVVIGLVMVLRSSASTSGHIDSGSGRPGPPAVATGEVQPPSSEVHNG